MNEFAAHIGTREDGFKTYLPVLTRNYSRRQQQVLDYIETFYPCDNFGEDALDHACVPFDEVEDGIALACYLHEVDEGGEFINYAPDPFSEAITPVMISAEQRLELAREGYLVSVYLDRKTQ